MLIISAEPHITALESFLRQVSPESEKIYDIILEVHAAIDGDWDKLTEKVSADDLKLFLEYASQFLSNLGNYKSFGDVKFIPASVRNLSKILFLLAPRPPSYSRALPLSSTQSLLRPLTYLDTLTRVMSLHTTLTTSLRLR